MYYCIFTESLRTFADYCIAYLRVIKVGNKINTVYVVKETEIN